MTGAIVSGRRQVRSTLVSVRSVKPEEPIPGEGAQAAFRLPFRDLFRFPAREREADLVADSSQPKKTSPLGDWRWPDREAKQVSLYVGT